MTYFVFCARGDSGQPSLPYEAESASDALEFCESEGIVDIRSGFGVDNPIGPRTAIVIKGDFLTAVELMIERRWEKWGEKQIAVKKDLEKSGDLTPIWDRD